jgi:general secretion pathway protein N
MASWTMRRYGLCIRLGVGLVLFGGGIVTLIAAPPPDVDLPDAEGQSGSFASRPPDTRNEAPGPALAQAAEPVRSRNPLWAIPIKDLTATRDRPIFSPSRRPRPPAVAATPYVPPPPTVKPVGPQRPQLALVGTVVNAHEGFGIFLDQATNTVVRLKTGEGHNGWILRSVQGREATLEKGRDTAVLALPARDADRGGALPAISPPIPQGSEPLRNPPPKVRDRADD